MSNSSNTQFKPKDSIQEQAAILASMSSGAPTSQQDALARLLTQRLHKEMAEEQLVLDQVEAFRNATLTAIRTDMAKKERNQAQCGHMKENGRSALGGQKDSNQEYHFICQFCFKEFNQDLPPNLRIPADMIGGPQ